MAILTIKCDYTLLTLLFLLFPKYTSVLNPRWTDLYSN